MRTFLPELFFRPLWLLDPNSDSSTLLPRETTLYFLEPLERAEPAPDASLLASEATSAMTKQALDHLFRFLFGPTLGKAEGRSGAGTSLEPNEVGVPTCCLYVYTSTMWPFHFLRTLPTPHKLGCKNHEPPRRRHITG